MRLSFPLGKKHKDLNPESRYVSTGIWFRQAFAPGLSFLFFFLLGEGLLSQSIPYPQPDAQDSFQCTKIPTQVDGIDYDKTLKCETKDAICYIIEGFSMSCVPKLPLPTDPEK